MLGLVSGIDVCHVPLFPFRSLLLSLNFCGTQCLRLGDISCETRFASDVDSATMFRRLVQ